MAVAPPEIKENGVKIAMEEPPGPVDPSQKMKTSRFSPTSLSRGHFGPTLGPLEPGWMGPRRLKIDPCRPLQNM